MANKKNSRRKRNSKHNSSYGSQALPNSYSVPGSLTIRNNQKVRYVLTTNLTGGNMSAATTLGYAYYNITSAAWSTCSAWTQLSALYQYVRPYGCRVSITFNRATGNTDNPRVAFVPTPAGTPVGTTSMSLSTLESPTGRSFVGGPGTTISGNIDPSVLISCYGPITNGYMPMRPSTLSLTNLPTVYYGDILLFTPSVNVTTVTAYVMVKLEFMFEFSVLNPSNIQ